MNNSEIWKTLDYHSSWNDQLELLISKFLQSTVEACIAIGWLVWELYAFGRFSELCNHHFLCLSCACVVSISFPKYILFPMCSFVLNCYYQVNGKLLEWKRMLAPTWRWLVPPPGKWSYRAGQERLYEHLCRWIKIDRGLYMDIGKLERYDVCRKTR